MSNVFRSLAILTGGLGLLAGLAVGLWVMGRLTNTLQYYATPTDSNAPTMKTGDKFFATSLLKPKRLDFIAYNMKFPGDEQVVFTHRLCGVEGDKVEIRRGRLYVNGQDADAGLRLAHHYTMARQDYARLPGNIYVDSAGVFSRADSTYNIGLPDAAVSQGVIRAVRQNLPVTYSNPMITKHYAAAWNQDHFGPVLVPKGCYFVLGDNRQNANDSRYTGWLPESDFVGTVLGKN